MGEQVDRRVVGGEQPGLAEGVQDVEQTRQAHGLQVGVRDEVAEVVGDERAAEGRGVEDQADDGEEPEATEARDPVRGVLEPGGRRARYGWGWRGPWWPPSDPAAGPSGPAAAAPRRPAAT